MLPKVTIIPTTSGGYAVYINNEELPGVTAVHIDIQAGCMPKVEFELLPKDITVNMPEAEIQGE